MRPAAAARTHDVAPLIAQYPVGDLKDFWIAQGGIENINYFVQTVAEDGAVREFVLTIVDTPSNAPALLVELLDACAAAGLPVAPVVRTRAGAEDVAFEGQRVLLAPKLPGRHVSNPTFAQCEALGRFMARFHQATRHLADRAPDYPRDPTWLAARAAAVEARLPLQDRKLIDDIVRMVRSLLKRKDVQGLPRGIIHGDLFRDNVLFNDRGLAGVLDFHHAARGHWIYDLAVAINDWCNDAGGVADPERTLALVEAYHRIRPLRAAELWFLPAFSLYAAVAFWLSRLEAAAAHRPGARFKNPTEFRDIAAQHSARFFYLDRRLLD